MLIAEVDLFNTEQYGHPKEPLADKTLRYLEKIQIQIPWLHMAFVHLVNSSRLMRLTGLHVLAEQRPPRSNKDVELPSTETFRARLRISHRIGNRPSGRANERLIIYIRLKGNNIWNVEGLGR